MQSDSSENKEAKSTDQEARKLRWRMVLGEASGSCMGGLNDQTWIRRERTIRYLYDRDHRDKRGKNVRQSATGGLEDSQLTVQDWINDVHELFPQKVIEQIEKDALEKYQLNDLVTNPEALSRAKPSEDLLRAVLRTKHLMNQEVLEIARSIVRKIVQELMEKLMHDIRSPFLGAKDRRRRSSIKIAKNFDTRATILKNLKHYSPEKKQIFIETPIFISRVKKHNEKCSLTSSRLRFGYNDINKRLQCFRLTIFADEKLSFQQHCLPFQLPDLQRGLLFHIRLWLHRIDL